MDYNNYNNNYNSLVDNKKEFDNKDIDQLTRKFKKNIKLYFYSCIYKSNIHQTCMKRDFRRIKYNIKEIKINKINDNNNFNQQKDNNKDNNYGIVVEVIIVQLFQL
jgi:hypothetical protein